MKVKITITMTAELSPDYAETVEEMKAHISDCIYHGDWPTKVVNVSIEPESTTFVVHALLS